MAQSARNQVILQTKIQPPSASHIHIDRPLLNNRLDEASTQQLTLVLAPAGFGKTSVVADWARQQTIYAVAWLSLEDADNDLYRFFTYVIATLQTIDPAIGQAGTAQLNDHINFTSEVLLTHLINDISEVFQPIVLVMDDYHLIKNKLIDHALTFLIEHAPPQLRLILICREEPNLPIHKWRIDGLQNEIGINQLRFSEDETKKFFYESMALNIEIGLLQQLEQRTEGWVAGLQIAALIMKNERSVANSKMLIEHVSGKHHYVIDYLGQEVLKKQDEQVRSFLIETSILDEFCADLCDAVTQQDQSLEIIIHLKKNKLFLVNLDSGELWYRYHHLFAEFLQGYLSPELRQRGCLRASYWYETEGNLSEATKYALAGKDVKRVEMLLEKNMLIAASSGKLGTMFNWLSALPQGIIMGSGSLSAALGWLTYLRGDMHEARRLLSNVHRFPIPGNSPIHAANLYGFKADLANAQGIPEQAISEAQQCIDLLEKTGYEGASFFLVTAYKLLADAQQMKGNRRQAVETFQTAVRLSRQWKHPLIIAKSSWHLALLLSVQGQRRDAVSLCHQLLNEYTTKNNVRQPLAGFALIPLGLLTYEANEVEAARKHLTEGLPLLEQVGMVRYMLIGYHILAKIYLLEGNQMEALNLLHKARLIADNLDHIEEISLLSAGTAELYLAAGNTAIAQRWLSTAESKIPLHSPLNPERLLLTKAQLLIALEKYQEAEMLLKNLRRRATEEERFGRLIRINILQANIKLSLHKTQDALNHLREAIQYAAPERYIRPFIDTGLGLIPLLTTIKTPFPQFVDELCQAFENENDPAPHPNPSPPIDLTEREIEIMSLVAKGETNQAIAEQLHLTKGTIKWYLYRVYKKLKVNNRTQAISLLKEGKLI